MPAPGNTCWDRMGGDEWWMEFRDPGAEEVAGRRKRQQRVRGVKGTRAGVL